MEYRREIDGLRALAVLPVILFHAGFQTFRGGFVGVDVFLVISGYLITAHILEELQQGRFSIIDFYERRARRILPALFFVMLVCLPFAWLWLLPKDLRSFSQSLVAVVVYVSNVLFWQTSDYFDTLAELKPLLHTWSLAVEEQYYLLFPMILQLTWRLGTAWMLAVLGAAAVISLGWAHWGSTAMPAATFYLLPTRAWELLVGAIIAFHFSSHQRWQPGKAMEETGSALGLLMLLFAVFFFDKHTPFPSLYTLIPTLGTGLIILFATPQTAVGKLLGHTTLVGIGLISYSAYLWHQPMFAFARHRSLGEPGPWMLAALVGAALLLAYVTWKQVETPFRNRQRWTRKSIFLLSALFSLVFMVIGWTGHFTKGFPDRLPKMANLPGIDLAKIDNGWCFYSIDTIAQLDIGENGLACWLGNRTSNIKGILFGDSYAGHYEPLWHEAGMAANVGIHAVTTNWCHPSIDQKFNGPKNSRSVQQCAFNRKYLINQVSHYDFAVLSGDWGSVQAKNEMQGVFDLIAYISPKVRTVVIMASPKQFDVSVMDVYKKSLWYGEDFNISRVGIQKDAMALEANKSLNDLSRTYDNVVFVDRNSLFVTDGKPSDVTAENIPFSLEGKHISIYGAQLAATTFTASPAFLAIKNRLH